MFIWDGCKILQRDWREITKRGFWAGSWCLSFIPLPRPTAWCFLFILDFFFHFWVFPPHLLLCSLSVFLPHIPYFFLFLTPYPSNLSTPVFFPRRMLQPMPKQEGRTVVVVNSPRTLLGSVPVRPPPGPELSAQPSPGPTPPVLPAPLLVSASPAGPPPIPAPRPPVLLPPPQPNSGPLPQGESQGSQGAGGASGRFVRLGKKQ